MRKMNTMKAVGTIATAALLAASTSPAFANDPGGASSSVTAEPKDSFLKGESWELTMRTMTDGELSEARFSVPRDKGNTTTPPTTTVTGYGVTITTPSHGVYDADNMTGEVKKLDVPADAMSGDFYAAKLNGDDKVDFISHTEREFSTTIATNEGYTLPNTRYGTPITADFNNDRPGMEVVYVPTIPGHTVFGAGPIYMDPESGVEVNAAGVSDDCYLTVDGESAFDANGDGNADIVLSKVCDAEGITEVLYLGRGDGKFETQPIDIG